MGYAALRLWVLVSITYHQALPLAFSLGLISPVQERIKMHTLLDDDGYIPAFTTVRDAETYESRSGRSHELPKAAIVVFDKGFLSYPWFRSLGERSIILVTSLIRNAVYKVLSRCAVNRKTGITSAHIIEIA